MKIICTEKGQGRKQEKNKGQKKNRANKHDYKL